MKYRVSNSGIVIEGKGLDSFGQGIGLFDSEERGNGYIGILLYHNERVAELVKLGVNDPKIYLFNGLIYIVVEGDEYHYIVNLNRDNTGLLDQITRDKILMFGVLTEDEKDLQCCASADVIVE